MDKILQTIIDLIKFQTIKDNKLEMENSLEYVRNFYAGSKVKIKEFENNGIKTILAYIKSQNPKLLLHGHIDVVPAQSEEMYTAKIEDGKILGRGTNDMKSALAVMMHLIRDLSEKDLDIGLLISTDEEIGGYDGAGYVVKEGIKPDFFLSGEPTGLKIGNQAKGVINLEITITGKGAHSSTPWEGENAILKMNKVIEDLLEIFPEEGDYYSTINLSKILGGEVTNKVAEKCRLIVNIRYIPDDKPEEIIEKIKQLGVEVKILAEGNCVYCPKDNPHIKKLQRVLSDNGVGPDFIKKHGSSDARHFCDAGIPAIVFGPNGKGSHAADESMEIDSLKVYYDVLRSLCLEIKQI